MPIKKIKTMDAPAAIGPYSQAIQHGNWLFLSGQIPLHPETGEVVGQDITVQTEQVLKNLLAVLASCGKSLSNVVQTTVYLADLKDFSQFNQVYSQFFNPPYPARSTVQVGALPRGVKLEIAAIANIENQR